MSHSLQDQQRLCSFLQPIECKRPRWAQCSLSCTDTRLRTRCLRERKRRPHRQHMCSLRCPGDSGVGAFSAKSAVCGAAGALRLLVLASDEFDTLTIWSCEPSTTGHRLLRGLAFSEDGSVSSTLSHVMRTTSSLILPPHLSPFSTSLPPSELVVW
jgi:hypothetical protein